MGKKSSRITRARMQSASRATSSSSSKLQKGESELELALRAITPYLQVPDLSLPAKGARFFDKAVEKRLKRAIAVTREIPNLAGAADEARLLSTLVRWHLSNAFLLDDFARFTQKASSGHRMTLCMEEMDRDAEAIKAFLMNYVLMPDSLRSTTFSVTFSNLLTPVLGKFAHGYMSAPLIIAQKLTIDVNIHPDKADVFWQQSFERLLEAQSRYQYVRNLLQIRNHSIHRNTLLSVTFIIQLNQALQNTGLLMDAANSAFLARARLPAFPLELLKFLDAPVLPSLSHTQDRQTVNAEFLKLVMAIRHCPDVFQDENLYKRAYVWLSHPNHIQLVSLKIVEMTEAALKDAAEKDGWPAINHAFDVIAHRNAFDAMVECNRVLMFFYNMFAESAYGTHKKLINQLTIGAWQYHVSCIQLIETDNHEKLDSHNFQWFKRQQSTYYKSFIRISGILTDILSEISQGREPEGLNESSLRHLKQNGHAYVSVAMKIGYRHLLSLVSQNLFEQTDGAVKTLRALLDIIKAIPRAPERDMDVSKEGLEFITADKVEQYLAAIGQLLNEPPPALRLLQAMTQAEETLLEDLALPAQAHEELQDSEISALNALWSLKIHLDEHFQAGQTLSDATEVLVDFLHHLRGKLSGGWLYRVQYIEIAEKLLVSCKERIAIENVTELLMEEPLAILVHHLKRASREVCHQIHDAFSPPVKKLEQHLQKTVRPSTLQIDTSLDEFDNDLQRTLFLITLQTEMKRKWHSCDALALGQLVLKLADNPKAINLREVAFCHYARMIANQCVQMPREWVKAALGQFNGVLSAIPEYGEYVRRDERLRQKILFPVQLALREALLWHDEGEIAHANASIRNAQARLDNVIDALDVDEATQIKAFIETSNRIVNEVNSYAHILAFLINPHPPEEKGPYTPPSLDAHENATLLNRFKNAWFALSANAGILNSREEAVELYNAWVEEFKGSKSEVTTKLLNMHWQSHYNHFCQSLTIRMAQVEKEATIPTPRAASPLVVKKEKTLEIASLEERRRLEAIERYNQKSMLRHQQPRKIAVRKSYKSGARKRDIEAVTEVLTAMPESPQASSSQPPEPVTERTLKLPSLYSNPPLAQEVLERIESAGYRAYVTGGYVRDALLGLAPQDADILTDCPPLKLRVLFPEITENSTYPGVFHRASRGCDLHLMSQLPEQLELYKNAYIVVNNDDAEKLYYIKADGEYEVVKIDDFSLFIAKINRLKACDEVILPLDPAKIRDIITSNGGHTPSREEDSLVVDIICREGQTLQQLVAGLDFTVNAFLVTARNELIIPIAESVDDFNDRVLRTIVPYEESMQTDPSRIFRQIRLTNQLRWNFEVATEPAARKVGHLLSRLEFFVFLKHFCKCFLNNRDVAYKNLQDFLRLELLEKLFSAKSLNKPLSQSLKAFIESTFWQILDGPEDDRHVEMLALFSLAMMRNVTETKEVMAQWMKHSVPEQQQYRIGRIAKLLPERIQRYYSMMYQQKEFPMNPMAPDFELHTPVPCAAMTHAPETQLSHKEWPVLTTMYARFFTHADTSSSSAWPARAASSSQQAPLMPK